MGSLSLVKSGKLYHTFRFPPVFGSCNSKMLLVKSWDNMDPFWKIYDSLSSKSHFYHRMLHATFLTFFDVKIIKFNRFYNRKIFLFHVSFELVWNKKYFSSLIIHEKKYFIFQVRYTAIIFQKTYIVWIFSKYVSVSQALESILI